MNLFKRSLAFNVVAVITVSFALLSGLFVWNQYRSLKAQAFDEAMVDLRTILMISQSRLDKEFRVKDMASVERETLALNLLDDVRLSAVLDERGIVLYSSRFVILGSPVEGQLKQFDASIFHRIQKTKTPIILTAHDKSSIYAYYPLIIDSSESSLRPDRIGVLFVEWSLSRPYRNIDNMIRKNVLTIWGLIALVMAALMLVLQRIVLKPLKLLKSKADRIADYQESLSFSVEGIAELGDLSKALNRMNIKLTKSLSDVRASERRWSFALDGGGDGVQDWNLLSNECYFSPNFKALLGLPVDAGMRWDDWKKSIHIDDWVILESKMDRHIQGLSSMCRVEYRLLMANGEERFILMRGKVVEHIEENVPCRFVAMHSDVTSSRHMEDALRSSEEQYRKLFELVQEGIWLIDARGYVTLMNAAVERMLGYKKEEMLGKYLLDFVEERNRFTLENNLQKKAQDFCRKQDIELYTKTGRCVHATLQTAPLFNEHGDYNGAIVGVVDITERKIAEERVREQALFDELTKLPNRRMINEKLSQEFARSVRHNHIGALLFIDLDHFKNVNDSLGHPVGDALLVAISDRLRKLVRDEDTLSRLGGDEFVILLPELNGKLTTAAAEARIVALKIQEALSEVYDVSGRKLNMGCSIGIALYPMDQETIHDIMKQADAAMYRAKAAGRSSICLFSKEMHEQVEQNLTLQMLLPGALEKEQFMLYFQPQVNDLNQLIGAEVLLRWQEPDMGFIRPDYFIRAAEESGQIIALGDWVIRRSFEQIKKWFDQGLPPSFKRLAINISARQFGMDDFVERLEVHLQETGISAELIELEITESMLLNRLDQIIEKMHVLNAMGFAMALDDFGTGYSSLSYLRALPLHKLKIDQAFVRDIQSDRNDSVIVETIISMAKHMELEVIAEGVEEEFQLMFLKENGCHQYQGYYFSKPIPAQEFDADWLLKERPAPDS